MTRWDVIEYGGKEECAKAIAYCLVMTTKRGRVPVGVLERARVERGGARVRRHVRARREGIQDRLHGPAGPGHGELVRESSALRGEAQAAHQLPRRLPPDRHEPHVAEPDHARGHRRERMPPLQLARDAGADGGHAVHALPDRPGGLHAGRLP